MSGKGPQFLLTPNLVNLVNDVFKTQVTGNDNDGIRQLCRQISMEFAESVGKFG